MTVINRRTVLTGSAIAASAAAGRPSAQDQGGIALSTWPERVFKIVDLAREDTEAWIFSLRIRGRVETADRMTLSFFSGHTLVATEEWSAAVLAAVTVLVTERGFSSVRIICRKPTAVAIDRMRVDVTFADQVAGRLDIPVNTYRQTVELDFPFRGNGIVTATGAVQGGHRNASGQFAIDAMGLNEAYAVQTGSAFEHNTDLAGFGREIGAPADGLVVHAKGDRPDQPVPGRSDEAYHVPEFRGAGDPGNHVVIDHGGGEFSMIAHLSAGSLAVAVGERVTRGQRLGALGNSGDSFAPHVHHQLQDGPDWTSASALPHVYRNMPRTLTRGTFFSAE